MIGILQTQSVIAREEQMNHPPSLFSLKTNKTLIQLPLDFERQYCLYIPSYVRFEIRRIVSYHQKELRAQIHGVIKLDLDITGLPQYLITYIRSRIILIMQHEPEGVLKMVEHQSTLFKERTNKGKRLLKMTVLKNVNTSICCNRFWTPFESLYLMFQIKLKKIRVFNKEIRQKMANNRHFKLSTLRHEPQIWIKFNIMDYKFREWADIDGQCSIGQMATVIYGENRSYGHYNLSEKLIKVTYSNKQKNSLQEGKDNKLNCCKWMHCLARLDNGKESKQQLQFTKENNKINSFNNAHFSIALSRTPIATFIKVLVPIWLLILINLAIFFQQNSLGDRIISLSTVMLAYVVFTTSIKNQLPSTPAITFIDIVNYLGIFVIFLTLIESWRTASIEDYVFEWRTNPQFILALLIEILIAIAFVLLLGWYELMFKPSASLQESIKISFDVDDWENGACDNHFNGLMNEYGYRIIQYRLN